MIVTTPKSLTDLLGQLPERPAVFLAGCGDCATLCQSGGEDQVAALRAELERAGYAVTGSAVIETPCDERIVRRDLAAHRAAVDAAGAVVVLACGVGCQSVAGVTGKRPVPALDTVALVKVKRIGQYADWCRQCGDCLLGSTGGICPVTRCSKGLRNGPCGGAHAGKCEVDPDRDCGWQLILDAVGDAGRARLAALQPPRDHRRRPLTADRKDGKQ